MDTGWDVPIRADIDTPLVIPCIRCHLCVRRTFAKLRGGGVGTRVVYRINFRSESLRELGSVHSPLAFEFGVCVAECASGADGGGCVQGVGGVGVEGGES